MRGQVVHSKLQRLVTSRYTCLVPVKTVIVDEASQIELGDYLPLQARFGRNIKKLVFIGDDKQRKSFCRKVLSDTLNK